MCFKILSGASGTDFKDLDVGTTLGGEATAVYFHVLQPLHFSARVTVDLTQKLSITPYHCCGVFRQTGLQGGSSRGEFCFQNKWKFYEAFVLLCEDIYWNWKVPGRTSAEFNSKPWEVLPVGRRNNLDLENKEFIISNDQNDSPGRTCSHADCMAWRVSPAWLLSATQMYSPASSSVTLDKWRVLVLEELLCRGCMRKTLSQRQKSCKSACFFVVWRPDLTVRALIWGWLAPVLLDSDFSHCTLVNAGLWTLHSSLAWPPNSTVVFLG